MLWKPGLLIALSLLIAAFHARAAENFAFETFRWNEDYRYLSEEPGRSAYEDLKYRPFEIAGEPGFASFGGSLRSRVNVFDDDRFGLQGGRDGALWLQRFYGHAAIDFDSGFRAFVELSADYADAHGELAPGPFDKDKAALGQAFFDWRVGGAQWRLGRQEAGLGSARLMGTRDGSNVRRSYDGLRWDKSFDDVDLRLFYLQVVNVDERSFDNSSDGDDAIWGLNSTWSIGEGNADVYYLGSKRHDAVYAQGIDDETRHSAGARLFGSHDGWDWDVEALYQFGDFGEADIRAWTTASVLGYRLSGVRWRPRLALSANVASGDRDPTDSRLQTFNPLFPNLAYFEEAAIYAPQNFYNIEPEISWMVTPKLGMALDWSFFWRLEENDAVYVRGLNPLPGTAQAGGDFVAHTPSVSIDYQWNRHLSMDLSYSHFFIGEVIRNAGGSDVDFFKLQAEWKF